VAERGGYGLMPELGYKPVNRYLPPRARAHHATPVETPAEPITNSFLRWIDRALSR
jgi:hypothetical protein